MPVCQRGQRDTTTITRPQESSPELPAPSMASPAGRNRQLQSQGWPCPHTQHGSAVTADTPNSSLRFCPDTAAAGNTRHGCCQASTVGSVHTHLLNACGHQEIIHYGARVGCRRPAVGSLLCHTLPRMLVYFLEAQFITTEMTPRLPDWRAGGSC